MKNFKKPLIFIVILLGLAGLAYWDEWQTEKDNKAKEMQSKLLSFQPDQIVKLDYKKVDDGQTVEVQMVKDGSQWKMLAPVAYPGDTEAVDRLMKTFEDLRFEKSFEATDAKVKEFGLDQPKVALTLTDKDGKATKIRIGAKSPVGYSSYAKVDDSNNVYLVNHYAFTASNKEVFDFRDKGLRLPNTEQVKAISYQYEHEPLITLKRQDKDWTIESPKQFKADATAVKQFLSFFENQRVAKFMDEPSAAMKEALSGKKAGTTRLATLILTGADDKLTQYAFMENGEDVYTTIPGYEGIIVLDKKIKDGLKKSLADFQDKAMFTFNSTEATEVDLDGKLFVKKDGEWQSKDSGDKADFVRLMLVDFEFAKAAAVLTAEEAGPLMQGAPLHATKFTFKDGKTVEASIWKIDGDAEHIAMKVGTSGFFKAPRSLLENFDGKPKLSEKLQPGDQG
ncbi:DUF4340 domain-containing protein [Oligoflexus tunisiensis]|uniref:DUF4340 domain-containing protein n=1 Tax=Oligoflexus tunisiensis TaxID=708132 RepID=UPI000A438373|nr:DUF4340 domain-containing protein [Oligoflexus tunisiensis]